MQHGILQLCMSEGTGAVPAKVSRDYTVTSNREAGKGRSDCLITPDDKTHEAQINEAKQLCSGVFWIITDNHDLSDYTLLSYSIPCDTSGMPIGSHSIPLNAKSGLTYNHKKLWEQEISNNPLYRLFNKKDFDYFPRGRVVISNSKAVIYLNPGINTTRIIDDIKREFGLTEQNISYVRVHNDNSQHYKCFLDT